MEGTGTRERPPARVRILGGRNGTLFPYLLKAVSGLLGSDRGRAKQHTVIFVPEQYTLQAERDLISGLDLKGMLDLDVISPTKLATLIRETAGSRGFPPLDGAGRAMAIHLALKACAGELTYYQELGHLPGSVTRLDQTLTELRESGMTPENLEELARDTESGANQAKYRDLARIWRAYNEWTESRFDDPASAWSDACGRLEQSGLWKGARLFVYGFDTIRPNLEELLLKAAPLCAGVEVLLTMTGEDQPDQRIFRVQRESAGKLAAGLKAIGIECVISYMNEGRRDIPETLSFLEQHLFSEENRTWEGEPGEELSLFAAASPTAEALDAVATLTVWHRQGIPWKRMAVAMSGDSVASAMTAAMKRNDIPYFSGRKDESVRHGVCRLLNSALACVSGGYRTEELAQIAESGFGTLSRDEGNRLVRYAVANGIEYGKWKQPFTRGEDAEAAEALRQKLMGPLESLHGGLRAAREAGKSVEALVRFLEEEHIRDQLMERQQRLLDAALYADAIVERQVWDLLMNILDQLWILLKGRKVGLAEIAEIVSGALDRARLSSLPEDEEGVTLGEVGHVLPGETEALILTGVSDNVLEVAESGLLSDREREHMERKTDRRIGYDRNRMTMIRRADFYRTMTLPSRRLRVSFSLREEDGTARMPGEPVLEMKRIFPALREEGGVRAEGVPSHPWTEEMALAGLTARFRELREGTVEDLPEEWKNALRALWDHGEYGSILRAALAQGEEDRLESILPETALRLFQGEKISISRLECFSGCPYKHFGQYGLRPVEPGEWEFGAREVGDFFHAALDRYIRRATHEPDWPNISRERMEAILEGVLGELTADWQDSPLGEDAMGLWQGEEVLRRTRRAAAVLTGFAANSNFRVVGTEVPFGMEQGMPPVILTMADGSRVALQGKIDRLDEYRGPDGDCLMVMDLKSGNKHLVPAKMATGEQLQLMIYLKAAEQGRKGSYGAAAMYFPIQDQEVDAEDAETAEQARVKKNRLKGVALAEEDLLRALDRDVSPYSVDKVFNKDGSISKSADWALNRETLDRLKEAAVATATERCEEIRAGRIEAAPSVESADISSCTFCELQTVCQVKKNRERALDRGLTFQDVAEKNALRKDRN